MHGILNLRGGSASHYATLLTRLAASFVSRCPSAKESDYNKAVKKLTKIILPLSLNV